MSATKSLTQEQNRRIVDLLRKLRDRYGNQDDLAAELGIAQGTLSAVLSPTSGKGAGGKILAGLTRIAGPEVATIMGGESVPRPADELDTLSMARAAAENLARLKATDRDRAWLLMRDIELPEPSVDAFTQEALRRLYGTAGEPARSSSVPPSPIDPIGTRYPKRRAAGGRR